MRNTIARHLPSLDELNRLFIYDRNTGNLFRRALLARRHKIGSKAGAKPTLHFKYFRTGIGGRSYLIHRIVWKMDTGQEPPPIIDHIDGNPGNNQISNLRAATQSNNLHNCRLRKTNHSGHKGICWQPRNKKWRAEIMVNRKRVFWKLFDRLPDAVAAINQARETLVGDFARHT